MKKYEEIAVILNREKLTEEDGERIAAHIAALFNGHADQARALYDSLTPEGKDRLLLCAFLALFDLARWWIVNERAGWDERKKASAIFADRNLPFLSARFKEMTGLPAMPECSDDNISYVHLMNRGWNWKRYVDTGYEWMLGFMSKWCKCHSTLVQSFCRFSVKGILIPKYAEHQFCGNTDDGKTIVFPYI